VLAGLDWQPGDEVITTEEEHEAMNHPLSYLHTHRGLNFKRLKVSPEADVMIARLNEAYSPKTRLVAMSFVTCETGTRLPVKAICQWAAERNLLSLLDGAQVSGAISINVQDIGCDFYTSNGHKWLSGPKGTGFFYCRRDKLEVLSPAHVGAGSLEKVDVDAGFAEPFHTGQRFEFGTRAWSGTAGLGAALDWFESLGWDNVYRHISALNDYLKARILERPYLKLLSPIPFEQSSGLTTFVIQDHQAQEVANQLREQKKIYTRVIPHFNAMRIATAHFNAPQDIDILMAALDEICG
jgi:selenocysteine lyase/cysteine desulfurase